MLKKVLSLGIITFSLVALCGARILGHYDVSADWGGVFPKSSSNAFDGVGIASTNSALLLGTLRARFRRLHAIELNYARTNDSQVYTLAPYIYRVAGTVTEYTGAYVFRPPQFRKFQPFVFAGGGALRFNPGRTSIDGFQSGFGARSQTTDAFLYGFGADHPLWRFLRLRLQYRGLIYKEPTFALPMFFTGNRGHMAEPSIGIVYRF
jgi:hypothetical protein